MKKFMLAALFGALAAPLALAAEDIVRLKDGSVLRAQVIEESAGKIIVMDHGLKRVLDRDLVESVVFNIDRHPTPTEEPTPQPVPPSYELTDEELAYLEGVSDAWDVYPDELILMRRRGLALEELPVVYYLAERARVAPWAVLDLRLGGLAWSRVCLRLGLGPAVFYWDDLLGLGLAGPYVGIYLRFGRLQPELWSWNSLVMVDADIVSCVNLRFYADFHEGRPLEFQRLCGEGHRYDQLWFKTKPWGGNARWVGPHRYARRTSQGLGGPRRWSTARGSEGRRWDYGFHPRDGREAKGEQPGRAAAGPVRSRAGRPEAGVQDRGHESQGRGRSWRARPEPGAQGLERESPGPGRSSGARREPAAQLGQHESQGSGRSRNGRPEAGRQNPGRESPGLGRGRDERPSAGTQVREERQSSSRGGEKEKTQSGERERKSRKRLGNEDN